ncbi:hypothetical protein [Shinella pollutisoli]|uniref:Uncharacterized protein n=1 Tax=Shinella pollutisoli TaxID=2250594 RepID=A0ABV7DPH4_9HYPH|nr:hypothetical protein [Shinella pollutisoli]
MTRVVKTEGPASAATDPDHGSVNPERGKNMNNATNIISSVERSSLRDLIVEAESITAQMQTSADDIEVDGLSSDLLALNDRIIRVPVASLDDVQRKASYLLASADPLDAGIIEPLLRSLVAVVPA